MRGLNKSKLRYAITGALAASYYGNPRTTVDADFIVHIQPGNLDRLLSVLEDLGLEVSPRKIRAQLKTGYKILSLPDKESSYRADFIINAGKRLERRNGSFLGMRAYYQPPEELILAKLRMIKATLPPSRSFKDIEDVRAILQNTKVDREKIIRVARRETTLTVFGRILREPSA